MMEVKSAEHRDMRRKNISYKKRQEITKQSLDVYNKQRIVKRGGGMWFGWKCLSLTVRYLRVYVTSWSSNNRLLISFSRCANYVVYVGSESTLCVSRSKENIPKWWPALLLKSKIKNCICTTCASSSSLLLFHLHLLPLLFLFPHIFSRRPPPPLRISSSLQFGRNRKTPIEYIFPLEQVQKIYNMLITTRLFPHWDILLRQLNTNSWVLPEFNMNI